MSSSLLSLVLRRLGPGGAAPASRPDEDLFAAYLAGEATAFEELFRRLAPPLLGLMLQQVRQPEVARELVQQTFLQLHRARFDFRPGERLRPWVFTIGLNLRREHFRRIAARPAAARAWSEEDGPLSPPTDPVQGETVAAVRSALGSLPESQRLVIQLHWFEGLPFAEIATIAGASLSAVKLRAFRGYARLRELLRPAVDGGIG